MRDHAVETGKIEYFKPTAKPHNPGISEFFTGDDPRPETGREPCLRFLAGSSAVKERIRYPKEVHTALRLSAEDLPVRRSATRSNEIF